jgi:pilus assembly protein FimV
MVPTLPKPVQIPVEPEQPAAEPGFFQSVDPILLAGAGLLVAGLAVGGLYLRSRRRPESAETSFLESRLQPDSFFGASGGQRVDTRDATGGPSSMSYSLSQLDAIGDVDPVAEADVYLAYGRDLQAEEILKEALRSHPDRLAIRTKLLEVYAKRRDTKGFEQLATQLFGLTGGQGEDWARTQEMGVGIDPENSLYQPGGQPASSVTAEPEHFEPLGASTVPVSVMPAISQEPLPLAPAPDASMDADLDLDISAPAPLDFPEVSALPALAPEVVSAENAEPIEFDLPDLNPPPMSAAPATAPVQAVSLSALAADSFVDGPANKPAESFDFDLGSISLDLDEPKPSGAVKVTDNMLGGDSVQPVMDLSADPMARKLELAEEFRQIGDVDGSRELLQEVIATATDDALKAKAQSMLDNLS